MAAGADDGEAAVKKRSRVTCPWGPFGPTLAVTPEGSSDAEAAIKQRNSDWLRSLGVRWFDWGWREWRDDHEVWLGCLDRKGRIDRTKEAAWIRRSA